MVAVLTSRTAGIEEDATLLQTHAVQIWPQILRNITHQDELSVLNISKKEAENVEGQVLK